MLKKTTFTLAVTILLFSGCNSYPDSAESVAKAVCSELTAGNFDQLEQYVSLKQKDAFNKSFAQAKTFLNSDLAKKMLASMKCDKSDQVKEYTDGKKRFQFGQMKIKVHQVDGIWYFTK